MIKIILLLFLFPVAAFGHAEELGPGMMDWHWNMMGWSRGIGFWGFLFSITWIVWLIVGILAVVWLWGKMNKQV